MHVFILQSCLNHRSGRVCMGSKSEIFMFFNSGYAHERNISIFRRRASTVTGNTLIEPKYASVRQSRDSLHRTPWQAQADQKVAAAPCSETPWAKKLKKFTEKCFMAHYYACTFGVNRLRIDGDIRQKAAIAAIFKKVVIAIYRLRPTQRTTAAWRGFLATARLSCLSIQKIKSTQRIS